MKKKKQQMLGNLEIAAFCDQLSMIVSAGIPIYEGISILQEDAPEEEKAGILLTGRIVVENRVVTPPAANLEFD